MIFFIDGVESADFTPFDRGLQFGHGVFETIGVAAGLPLLWPQHLARLQRGCERLHIPFEPESIQAQVIKTCQSHERAVLKLIITAGDSTRGYAAPDSMQPRCILSITPWSPDIIAYRQEGVDMQICTMRLSRQPKLAGIKHLNRLEQVLATTELKSSRAKEGLMLDSDEHIICGTRSNIFLQVNDKILTPNLSHCGIEGIMRDRVIQILQEKGYTVAIENIDLNQIKQAQALFITNSLIGLWPIKTLEAQHFESTDLQRQLLVALEEDIVS